jgi:predicted HTH transcriptional regulator
MNNGNCNNRSSFPKIFTLLAFIFGFVLYILLKRAREEKERDIRMDDAIIPKRKKLPEKVNKVEKPQIEVETIKLSDRQKKIIKLLLVKEKVYPSELQDLLSNVSARTVRRDMTDLEKKGLVEQKGTTKSTYYKYIGS